MDILGQEDVLEREILSHHTYFVFVEYLGRYNNLMSNIQKSGIGIKSSKNDPIIPFFNVCWWLSDFLQSEHESSKDVQGYSTEVL